MAIASLAQLIFISFPSCTPFILAGYSWVIMPILSFRCYFLLILNYFSLLFSAISLSGFLIGFGVLKLFLKIAKWCYNKGWSLGGGRKGIQS